MRLVVPPAPLASPTWGDPDEPDLDAVYAYPPVPWLRVNMIASADGAAVVDGGSRALGSDADRQLLGLLRGLADVVVVGAGTVRAEGYGPLRPRQARRDARIEAGLAPVPRLAVVTHTLDLDLTAPVFTEPEVTTLVVTCEAADPDRLRAAGEVAEVVLAGGDRVDLGAALDALVGHGLPRMLCEGGPGLLGGLAAADRVDDLCLTVAPVLAGGDASRIARGPDLVPRARMRLAHALEDDSYLYLRYTR
ncbi:MAG: pyrimidine reductase family protein [Streptosporangiales bacterium]|nr:pyrimidine reductase family protein [Streptosporangiales bacterium]